MAEEVPMWVQEASRTEFKRLRAIAVRAFNSNHGSFLRAFADAWLKADLENQRLLAPAWVKLIAKYRLDARARVMEAGRRGVEGDE